MEKRYVNGIVVGVKMSQHFKIGENGNIRGVCPKEGTTIHNTVYKLCEDCLSFNAPLGIPTLIICRCNGVEGYTYSPIKKETDNARK